GSVLAVNARGNATFLSGTPHPVGKKFIDVVAERWRAPLGRAVAQVSGKAPMQVMAVGATADKGADPDEARVQPLRSVDGAVSGVLITVEGPRQPHQRLSEQMQIANAEGRAAHEELGGH